MIFPTARKIAKELDWYASSKEVFGLHNNYFFIIGDSSPLDNGSFTYIIASTADLSKEQKSLVKNELNSNKEFLKINTFVINKNEITITISDKFFITKDKEVYTIIDYLVGLFKESKIKERKNCFNCERKDFVKVYELNYGATILCTECYSNQKKNFIEEENNKTYSSGILGSILFAIPALILWVYLGQYLGNSFSALSVLPGLFVVIGYKYFKGKYGKSTIYILGAIESMLIVIGNLGYVLIEFKSKGLTLLNFFVQTKVNQEIRSIFYENLLVSFFLCSIFFLFIVFNLKHEKKTIQEARKM
ncbi:hypothetical protein SAMN06298216_2741 [Spirosomataceae bacterium TFI 002]|nr:hypothetical protein SAMN06298216_2741 [Spirosomataceae bacterium TFI 002]